MNTTTGRFTNIARGGIVVCVCGADSPNGAPNPDAPTGPSGGLSAEDIDRLVADAKAASVAPSTRKTYRCGWKNWSSWASGHGVPVLPARPQDLQRWLVWLADQGKKPNTLDVYLAAVAHKHDELLDPNPARDPRVRRVRSGLRRQAAEAGYVPKQAAPLRRHHVDLIADAAFEPRRNQPGGRLETPEQAAHRALIDIALVAVAHDALLRGSELLALRWGDINMAEDGRCGLVRIRRSKTDQTANGAVAPISKSAYQALQRINPPDADPEDHIFNFSATTLNRRIKAAAQAASIDPANISSHSPRVGTAQDLVSNKIDMAAIMLAGRWTTPAMIAHYTKRLAANDNPAAKHLQTQHRPTAKRPRRQPLSQTKANPLAA
ncbi:tyrosine-type recombinase/integrase [Candidatus Poriferisocius sp.]|uniref:tyrosine-type recombinase/integrase n=1 Tax=Candidatus Poriferisocius sp. TaxID=3101276 RepID=UPI003B52A05F